MKTFVVRQYRFEAAHHLAWHTGKCRRRHGHSYVLEVRVAGETDDRGVVMDFAEVDALVDEHVLRILDHNDLNEVLSNPTAELVAAWIGEVLSLAGLRWCWLRLWETEDGSVIVER